MRKKESFSTFQTLTYKIGRLASVTVILGIVSGAVFGCQSPFAAHTQKRLTQLLDSGLALYAGDSLLKAHELLADPESYGIDTSELSSYPDISVDGLQDKTEEEQELLDQLDDIKEEDLTAEEAVLLHNLQADLSSSIAMQENFPYYTSTLGSKGAMLSLISSLSHYPLSDAEDVSQYLSMLKELPAYLEELLNYEKDRQEAGLLPSPTLYQDTIQSITDLLMTPLEENILITSFESRLQDLSGGNRETSDSAETSTGVHDASSDSDEGKAVLTDTEIEDAISENTSLITDTVLPAYQKLWQSMLSDLTPSDEKDRIAQYADGRAYYTLLLQDQAGTDMDVQECEEVLNRLYQTCQEEIAALQEDDPDLYTDYYSALPAETDPVAVMEDLREQSLIYFPASDGISYEIKETDYALSTLGQAAYYIVPAYGSDSGQEIYLNRLQVSSEDLSTTLAHEGYPGHMYQTNYMYENLTHPIQLCLRSSGFDEGWATYAELFSCDFLTFSNKDEEVSKRLQSLYRDNILSSLCLCSLSDIYVNYKNHTYEEFLSWLSDYGISESTASNIYHAVINQPASYLSYSIGYYELSQEIEELQSQDGCSIQDAHKEILRYGSCRPSVLRSNISDHD